MRTKEQHQAAHNGLSTKEVADRLDCSQSHVVGLIEDGVLRAIDIARAGKTPHYKVFEDDLEAFVQARATRPKDAAA